MGGEDAVLVRLARRSQGLLWLFVVGVAGCVGAPPSAESRAVPGTMLWTWERAEDLSFLAERQDEVGAAVLVATVELRSPDRIAVRANRNPVRLPVGLARIAVVRIENPHGRDVVTHLDDEAHRSLVSALSMAARRLAATGLQLDFDALRSQRGLYARLLGRLRRELPPGHSLGITALASWCAGDPWLDELPDGTVDYAVPMLFRMGPDAKRIRSYLERGGGFRSKLCRQNVGLSTDEAWPAVPDGSRRWVFSPAAWDAASVSAIGVASAGLLYQPKQTQL